MLDTQEKAQIAARTSQRIATAYGIKEIEARLANLLAGQIPIESTYRAAERQVEEARERVREVQVAIRDREDEILLEVTEETVAAPPAAKKASKTKPVEDGQDEPAAEAIAAPEFKPRFTNDNGRKTAVTGRKKTDGEYLALKQALDQAQHALAEAQVAADQAKAAYNAMLREYHLMDAQLRMTTARIAALGGFDSAPTLTPAGAQQPAA